MHLYGLAAEETIECLNLSESLKRVTIELGEYWSGMLAEEEEDVASEIEANYCSDLFRFLETTTVPALKSLSLNDFPLAIKASRLTRMLNSRHESHGVANLESFGLRFDRSVEGYERDHGDVSGLRAVTVPGLNIDIEWAPGPISKDLYPELVRSSCSFFCFLSHHVIGCLNRRALVFLVRTQYMYRRS
jgi:hypothetical protein